MPSLRPHRSILKLLADRRGSTAIAFGVGALALFGTLAFATDASVWYAARRGAQNAADTAASAGVISLAMNNAEAARLAARDVTSRNGFVHTTGGATSVVVNIPPTSGPQSNNPSAVEVVVRQVQPMTAAGLFLTTAPIVETRSVATLRATSNVCVLALTGQLWAGGTANVDTPRCVLASNQRSGSSIEIVGNSLDITAYSLAAVAACQNCTSARVRLTERFGEYQVPVPDPFVRLQAKTLPRPTNGCINRNNNNSNLAPFEANGRRVYCGHIQVNGGETLNLSPGTYYIFNGDFRVQGGGVVRCPSCTGDAGVAIVLTGDPSSIGGIRINANSDVQLRAAKVAADADFNGILFYRDVRGDRGQVNNPSIDINGGTTMALAGGLYFPSTHIKINGNAGVLACSVIVAASIDFIGNADVTGCPALGTTVPRAQIVVMNQ